MYVIGVEALDVGYFIVAAVSCLSDDIQQYSMQCAKWVLMIDRFFHIGISGWPFLGRRTLKHFRSRMSCWISVRTRGRNCSWKVMPGSLLPARE